MRRRELITLVGGATAWTRAARAQQPDSMRVVCVLQALAADGPETKVVNLKSARLFGITVPTSILLLADEVIE